MTTTKALPLIHAPWPQYSAQVLEKACEENRLEELLTELVCDIINNSSISDETKFETGCRAICMIPPQQSAFIKKISAAFKAKGFWALAKSSWPAPKHGYNQALLQAQKEAVMQKNLSAALKLISKSEFVQKSLIEDVLNHLPDEKLIRSVARRDFSNFSSWFESLTEEEESLFFAGGYRFINPKCKENSAILDLFRSYDVEQRKRLFHIAPQLITPCDEVADLEVILKTLREIDAEQQAECAEAAALLCYDGLNGADKAALIKAVADLPIGRRSSLCESASMLNLRSIKLRRFRNKIAKIELSIKKSVVQGLSEKTPDTYSYNRAVVILKSLIQLDASQFAEKITAIKLHLDASQFLNSGHLESKAICDIIEGVRRGIPLSGIPAYLMEIQETDRESVISIYWKRFADVPEGDRMAVLKLLAQISAPERKFVSDFFKVKRHSSYPSQCFGKGYGYNNPKKNILEAIVSIPLGEVEETLLSAKSLMELFEDRKDHKTYLGVLAFVRKGHRSALVEKLSQMRQWKPRFKRSSDQQIFLRLLILTSKLSAEEISQEVFNILFRFEEGPEHEYRNQPQLVEEILRLPPELFSRLSFCYAHDAIDLLGQEGLKCAIEIAEANAGGSGPRFNSAIVKEIILNKPALREQMLERLRFRLENGESENEQLLAGAMIIKLFAEDLHQDEALALEASIKAKPELSPEETALFLQAEIDAFKSNPTPFSGFSF